MIRGVVYMGFCTSCGAQRVSETDRFCRSCGVPHEMTGAPTAPVTATPPTFSVASTPQPPQAPPAAQPTTWHVAGGAPTAPPPTPPAPFAPVVPGGGGGGTGKILATVGIVVALVAAGFVGYHFFWPRGGAGSPEGAAESLVMAASGQDPVGVLDMLSPAEVADLDEVYDTARDRAEDEDLIEGDGITEALEVELSDLEWEVDELGDDMARVTLVDGSYDVSWDPDKLPERLDFLADETEADSESGDLDDLFDGEEPSVMTVKVDGRWYVTLLGTAADYAYQEGEREAEYEDFALEEPDWDLAGEDVEPITGDDPEEVITNLVEAVNDGNAEDILANFPEDLGRPLRPYLPVIEDLKDEANWNSEVGLTVDATDLDLETEELDDGKVKVTISGGTFSGTANDDGDEDSGTLEVDGGCVTATEYNEYYDDYYGEYVSDTDEERGCLSDEEVVDDLGFDEFFFVVSEVDGGFQLDPAATLVEYANIAVDNFSGDMIDDIVDQLEEEY